MFRTAVGDIFGSAVKTRRQKSRVGRTPIAHTGSPLRRSLFLELLEDRRVLSTFAVLNTNDSGAGSLRQAIVDANANFGADTIQFASDAQGTITLASGQLTITDAVDIQGPGAGVIAISGNNATLVFHVSANATIRGLTISGGSSGNGGGIYNSGSMLVVNNCVFSGNNGFDFSGSYTSVIIGMISYSFLVGSGIYNTNGGVVSVNGSIFSNNHGSGIFNDSNLLTGEITLSVSDSTFAHNAGIFNPATNKLDLKAGGSIVNTGKMVVSKSTFSMNTGAEIVGTQFNGEPFTNPAGSGIGNYLGGEAAISACTFNKNVGSALFNYDPLPFKSDPPQSPTTKASVTDSTFSENIAGFGGGIASYGGVLEVSGSTFVNNSAVGLTQASGGGLNASGGGMLTLTNNTFTGNKSHFGGGIGIFFRVIATVTNTTVSHNVASPGHSGGIGHYLAPLTIHNSIFANNTSNLAGTHDLGSFTSTLSGSYNLIEDPNFAFQSRPLLVNTVKGDPKLGQLANYGGPTRTIPLLPGSPAIDAGSDASVLADTLDLDGDGDIEEKLPFDQRRFSRFIGTVDIGAFEAPGRGLDGNLGTAGDDVITIAKGTLPGTYKTTVNGVVTNNVAVDGIFLVNGLGGNDTITILDALAGGIVIDGGADSDSYTVNYGALEGPVTITDTGVAGSDSITVNGTGNDDLITKTSELAGTAVYIRREALQPETVDATGLEHVRIHGRKGNDTINDPGSDTEIFGDEGNDTLIVTSTAGNGVTLDGGDDSDTYILQAPNDDLVAAEYVGYVGALTYRIVQPVEVPGPIRINDTGLMGIDSVTVIGTIDADTITQTGDQIVANGETITLAGLESLIVDGFIGSGDVFTVVGAPNVAATVTGVADLVVAGTPSNDEILFMPGLVAGQVIATLNDVVVASSRPTGRIVAYGFAGDDRIQVAGSIAVPAWLYGDEGNDRLNAGNGGSLLFGGEGNDHLLGGGGRDIMIGGNGADQLVGNSNSDILVAGFTKKDDRAKAVHDAFWSSVLAEWNNLYDSFQVRVQKLSASGGLLPEVVDDLFDNQIDFLSGGAGEDWLIGCSGR